MPAGTSTRGTSPLTTDAQKTKRELLEEVEALRRRLNMQEALGRQVQPAEMATRAAAYHRVLEDAASVILEFDESGAITHVSPTIQSVLGYSPDEAMERLRPEWIHEHDRTRILEQFAKLASTGEAEVTSCRLQHKDGSVRMFEIIASPYRNAAGKSIVVAHARDITAAWEAERALTEARERMQLIDEMSQDIVLLIIDFKETSVIWANSGLTKLMGYTADDFRCAEDFSEKIHPDDRARVDATWYNSLRKIGDTSTHKPYRFRQKDGSYRWFEGGDRVCQNARGESQALSIMRDVTKTQLALEGLRESEQRYRIMDELNHKVILLQGTAEGGLHWANSAFFDVLGYTPEDMPNAEDYFAKVHPEDRAAVEAAWVEGIAEPGKIYTYPRHRVQHKDGSWRWLTGVETLYVSESGEQQMFSATTDITEEVQAEEDRRRLADQVKETQRLESLGVMAGGIAHDFNNLLTPIVGETSLALLDLSNDSPLRKSLLKIQRAAHRAAALTNQMLSYSGQGPQRIEPVDLSALVEEMGQLLESTVSGRAELSYSFEEEIPPVEGDSSQLSQVVMNLISNATDAVQESDGSIHVRTGVLEASQIDLEHIVGGGKVDSGCSYVFVEVTDDGCGMDPETIPRIFDPFFTTKFTGRGLGLASTVGIVRGHKGLIVLESTLHRGTRFQVLLPAARNVDTKAPAKAEPTATWRGEGTVLIVDDDEGVRELAAATLERAGLHTLLASNGQEGLDLFRLHANEISAVILDRTMPSIGGDTVFDEIRRIQPDAGVILISGYSEDVALAHIGKNLDAFLHKPFEPEALLDTVRHVMEAKPR